MSQDENETSINLNNEQNSENSLYFSDSKNINFLDQNDDIPVNLDYIQNFENSYSKSLQEYFVDDRHRYFINNIKDQKDQNEEETKEKSDKKKDYKANIQPKKPNIVNDKKFPSNSESHKPSSNESNNQDQNQDNIFPSSKNKNNSLLNNNMKKGNSIKQRNLKENTNGLNLNKSEIITHLGRKRKDCREEGNHNKCTTDNMIKKSFNLSHKFINKKMNKDLKKI